MSHHGPHPDSTNDARRCAPDVVSLRKRDHLWCFRCDAGNEADLVHALTELADDESCELDWFDAALVAYELGRRLEDAARRAGAATHDDSTRPQNRSPVQP
jgi:hypothetical protein